MQAWLGGKISYNRCLQLSAAVAIATFEIYRWKCLGYLFLIYSFRLCEKIFQKWTVFAFTES